MIERKKKLCKGCETLQYLFSKGRCQKCAAKEGKKLVSKPKNPILPTDRHKKAKDAERLAMSAFWASQQDELGYCYCKECELLGRSEKESSLGFEMNPYNVAHIISKGANPSFRCDLRNFVLLCAEHHNQFDCAARSEMRIYEETELIRQKLKLEDNQR
jgi:hypothetical protein